jgi:cell wall assembly regulator SMI1
VDEDRTIAQALAGVRDAESAFAFIEWFARDWLTPLCDSDGCTAEEVAAVEERLGLRLPASMAAFYRLLGCRKPAVTHVSLAMEATAGPSTCSGAWRSHPS